MRGVVADADGSVAALLRNASARLGADADARNESAILLAHACGRDRAWLIAHANDVLPAASGDRFRELVDRRAMGEPVAYLTGRQGFWTLDLDVRPGVLIPRPETELLVQLALERIAPDAPSRVADLGTGSGAVALAIARERPCAHLVGIDESDEALAIATANARRLGIDNVEFRSSDWMRAFAADEVFDLIVGNPPYLAADDPHLADGDLRFEPPAALVGGYDGLEAIRTITREARRHLRQGGELLLEHGAAQGEAVRAISAAQGYNRIRTWRDLAQHERVTGGVSAD